MTERRRQQTNDRKTSPVRPCGEHTTGHSIMILPSFPGMVNTLDFGTWGPAETHIDRVSTSAERAAVGAVGLLTR